MKSEGTDKEKLDMLNQYLDKHIKDDGKLRFRSEKLELGETVILNYKKKFKEKDLQELAETHEKAFITAIMVIDNIVSINIVTVTGKKINGLYLDDLIHYFIVIHKGIRIDNNEEIKGYLREEENVICILKENEYTFYPVIPDSVIPLY